MQVSSGKSSKSKGLMIGLIVHALAFLFGILHWWWNWGMCPWKKDAAKLVPNCDVNETLYSYCLIISCVCFLAAVIVNIAVDRKKGEAKLTSIIAIVGAVLALYYLIAWWVGDNAELIRKIDGPALSGWFKFGRILYWFYGICALVGGAIPAAMGGLTG